VNFSDQKLGFFEYLLTLTDDTGIFQHSVYGIPDPGKGYTTDDNCRALILEVMLLESFKEKNFLTLVSKYLAFVLNAQDEDGRFKNFMNYNREFIEEEGSEDCFGRCIWALGRTISSPAIPENMKRTCQNILDKSLKNWPTLSSPRAKASCIVGLSYLTETDEITGHIETLSMELVSQYKKLRQKTKEIT